MTLMLVLVVTVCMLCAARLFVRWRQRRLDERDVLDVLDSLSIDDECE